MTIKRSVRLSKLFIIQQIAVRRFIGFWLPIYLFFIGAILDLSDSANVFLVCAALASASAVLALYLIVFKLKEIRFSWVAGTGLLLGYAGGALNTSLGLMKDAVTLAVFTGHLQGDISFALMIALWVSAALFVSGALIEKPIKLNLRKLEATDIRLIWGSIAIILAAFASGRFGYMGAHYSEDFHVSPLSDFASLLCPALPAVTIFFLPTDARRSRRILAYGMVLLEFLLILPTGRRVLIYSLLVTVLAFNMRQLKLRLPLRTTLGLMIGGCLVIYPGMKFFYAMRVMTWRLGVGSESGIVQLATGAYNILKEGDAEFEQGYEDNVKTRTSIITYLAEMLAGNRIYTPLYGKDLWFCIRFVVPSVFYPDKSEILVMEEEITNPQFGLPIRDDANSILTTGIADFGLFGCFLYPLMAPLLFNFMIRFIQRRTNETAAVFAAVITLILLLQAEVSGTGCTGLARELILLTCAIVVIKKVPTLKPKINSLQGKRNANAYIQARRYSQPELPLPPI